MYGYSKTSTIHITQEQSSVTVMVTKPILVKHVLPSTKNLFGLSGLCIVVYFFFDQIRYS